MASCTRSSRRSGTSTACSAATARRASSWPPRICSRRTRTRPKTRSGGDSKATSAGVPTARDFKGQLAGTHPAAPAFVAEKKYIPERFPIAEKEVCYQGEIVAVVLADTKGQAADAANLIQVDYEELPAVMDTEKAM